MAIRKTHVKSAKRQKREKEKAEVREAAKKKFKKPELGRKQKKMVETGFRFKSQSERYKDISVDLKSLLDDAVERYGAYDVQERPDEAGSDDGEDDMISSPMATALAELALLNTSQPFQALQRSLYSLTRSLPLIVHHRHRIARTLIEAMTNANRVELALSASHTIDLLPAFIQSLSPDPDFQLLEFDNILSPLMLALVALALDPPAMNNNTGGDRGNDPHSQTEISKRAFQVLAWTFREIGGDLVNKGDHAERSAIAWSWVSEGLVKSFVERPKVPGPALAIDAMDEKQESTTNGDDVLEPDQEPDVLGDDKMEVDEGVPVESTAVQADTTAAAEDDVDEEEGSLDEELVEASVDRKKSLRSVSSTKPHLRRILATCFAFLVRKATSGETLDALVTVICSDLGTGKLHAAEDAKLQEALAWILLESSKSVETHIHSRASAIFKAFITHARARRVPSDIIVLKAGLTGLLHKSTSENLAGLVDVVLVGFKTLGTTPRDAFSASLDMQLAGVLAGTRKGGKVTNAVKEDMLVVCEQYSQSLGDADRADSVLEFSELATKVLLVAPGLEIMLSKGRKLLERLCQLPSEHSEAAAACVATLSRMKWSYFNDFATPLRRSLKQHVECSVFLSLLAQLKEDGTNVGGTALVLETGKDTITALQVWLQGWKNGKVTPRQVRHAVNCLTLQSGSTVSAELSAALADTVHAVLQHTGTKAAALADFEQSPLNAALVLSHSIRVLSSHASTNLRAADVRSALELFGWHRMVLQSLSELSLPEDPLLDLASLRPLLGEQMLSEDTMLRTAAIKMLAQSAPTVNALQLCLEAEAMPLTIQDAREKAIAIRKIGVSASKLAASSPEFDLALCYLIAMLKVNFKPLWSEAISAIANMAKNRKSADASSIWGILYSELLQATTTASQTPLATTGAGPWTETAADDRQAGPGIQTSDLRCTSHDRITQEFHANIGRLSDSSQDSLAGKSSSFAEAQLSSDRLTILNYEELLLKACSAISSITEMHSRDFVALFLQNFGSASATASVGGKVGRARIAAWLEVFTHCKNPKALFQSDVLYQQHLGNLSHGDNQIQTLALECILTWKSPNLGAHADHLRNLLDGDKFRDQLLDFSLAEESDFLLPQRRAEVVPILIRILYGLMSSRQGRASAMHVQKGRKTAIMSTLRGCTTIELDTLIDLMLVPFRDQLTVAGSSFVYSPSAPEAQTSVQIGYLSLCSDVLKYLGEKVKGRWHDLICVVINLAYHAQVLDNNDAKAVEGAPNRRVRQLALRRLADFFTADPTFAFSKYLPAIFSGLISPRLSRFADENIQAPSALLEVVLCWSYDAALVGNLVDHDDRLLPAVYACLSAQNVKDSVVSRVLHLVQNLLDQASDPDTGDAVRRRVLLPHLDSLLLALASLLGKKAGTLNVREELGMKQIRILAGISPFIEDTTAAKLFLPTLLPLFRKPNAVLPEHIKVDLLVILQVILPLALASERSDESELYHKTYETVSGLFATLRTRNARVKLVETFSRFSQIDTRRLAVVQLATDLNAFSTRRLEEPDFDRRLPAFNRLNTDQYITLNSVDWIPILHNMFFCIQDPEELSIRSNANLSLRRFVEVAGPSLEPALRQVFSKVFLPSLKLGLRSKVEMVRVEVLSVMSAAVEASSGVAELEEMKCLLADGNDEANFFNNLYHVQAHRRGRALRRLAEETENGSLSGITAAEIFIPLLGYNLTSISEQKQAELVNETVQSISRMAKFVPWSLYNRMLQHYLKLASEKREGQKVFLRTAVAILRSFHFDLHPDSTGVPSKLLPTVTQRLLPRLMQYLEARDSAEETLRIPMAEGIAAVLHYLPDGVKTSDVTNLLTALAQILKSKAQDIRDMARATLVSIVVSLGPTYLDTALKELCAALTRGPQLHVLAYTMHALLTRLAAASERPSFDQAAGNIAAIAYDDLFGQPSKDRESSEFRSKTKVKEVRSFKSLDSMEILAKHVSPDCVNILIGPMRDIITNTESFKTMHDVDDMLRRIAAGLQVNTAIDNSTLLGLCHGLIAQNTNFLKPRKAKKKEKTAAADYLVQMKRPSLAAADHYSQNAFRFVSFGLDLLNGAFRKNRFDLQDNQTISMLEPIIALVGETLFAEEGHVLERALRATASLVRCPLQSIDRVGSTLVKQIISVLEHVGTTSSEMAQTAIRTLATIIRERKSITLRDEQLSYLISVISPDMEETEQQPALFALLRAIASRTFVVPEIYDLMDRVAEILVTNQTSGTREICRSIYLQFLLDYPQGKKRLTASLEFLAKNLGNYAHESGRTSVLELLNAIFSKFTSALLDQYAALFFMSLTMDMANDESSKCREMAAENLKVLVRRVGRATRSQLLDMIYTWATAEEQGHLQSVAVQDVGLVLEAGLGSDENAAFIERMFSPLTNLCRKAADALDNDAVPEEVAIDRVDWQIPYHAIQSLSKTFKVSPGSLKATDATLWQAVQSLLLFPHVWVRNSAARLLAMLFASHQHVSTKDLIDAATKSALQLRSKLLDNTLSLQVVRNLFHIAKIFASTSVHEQNGTSHSNGTDANEEEGSEDDEGKDADDQERHSDPAENPLHWLFVKLSHRARVAHQTRPSMYSAAGREFRWSAEPTAILQWFGAVISEPSITVPMLEQQKQQIMIPLVRLLEDPNGAKDPQLDDLQNLAREVQELLSQKIGVGSVAETYSSIRRKMTMRREERKRTSALAVVNNPEIDAKRRAKKTENKAKAKKRKSASYADNKLRYGQKGGSKRMRQE